MARRIVPFNTSAYRASHSRQSSWMDFTRATGPQIPAGTLGWATTRLKAACKCRRSPARPAVRSSRLRTSSLIPPIRDPITGRHARTPRESRGEFSSHTDGTTSTSMAAYASSNLPGSNAPANVTGSPAAAARTSAAYPGDTRGSPKTFASADGGGARVAPRSARGRLCARRASRRSRSGDGRRPGAAPAGRHAAGTRNRRRECVTARRQDARTPLPWTPTARRTARSAARHRERPRDVSRCQFRQCRPAGRGVGDPGRQAEPLASQSRQPPHSAGAAAITPSDRRALCGDSPKQRAHRSTSIS